MEHWTLFSIIFTVFGFIVAQILYRLFLRPYLQLRAYKSVPGTLITWKIGKKILWRSSNLKQKLQELKGDTPFTVSENNTWLLKYPDLKAIVTNLFNRPRVTIVDHEVFADAIKNHDNYLHFFRQTVLGNHYNKHSMIFSTGAAWKRQRKLISKAFDFESMRKLLPIIQEIADETLAVDKFDGKAPVVLQRDVFMKYTWENLARSFFGTNLTGYTVNGESIPVKLHQIIKDEFPAFLSPAYQAFGEWAGIWDSAIRKQTRDVKEIGKVVERMLEDVKEKIKKGELKNADGRKGILELIIQSEDGEDALTNLELAGNFFSFSFAGTDTSSHTSTNTLYCLALYPEAKKKALEEVQANWDGKSPITLDTINKLEYIHALIMESLRVMTPVAGPLMRVAKNDHMLGSIPIKKGYIVQPLFTPTWFSPKWITDPDVFKPERWIRGHEERQQLQDVYIFNPFSFGPRTCIGQHFAFVQIKIALCYFLTRFDFEIPKDFKLTPMIVRGTQEPQKPIEMYVRPKAVAN